MLIPSPAHVDIIIEENNPTPPVPSSPGLTKLRKQGFGTCLPKRNYIPRLSPAAPPLSYCYAVPQKGLLQHTGKAHAACWRKHPGKLTKFSIAHVSTVSTVWWDESNQRPWVWLGGRGALQRHRRAVRRHHALPIRGRSYRWNRHSRNRIAPSRTDSDDADHKGNLNTPRQSVLCEREFWGDFLEVQRAFFQKPGQEIKSVLEVPHKKLLDKIRKLKLRTSSRSAMRAERAMQSPSPSLSRNDCSAQEL